MPRTAVLVAAAAALAVGAAAQSCYGPGERNQGESGYPAVPYKPCCSGKQATKVYGEWGFFCPGSKPVTDTNCYKPGERNQGAAGYPAVPYKPCCDGKDSVAVQYEWGRFCPGGTINSAAPAPASGDSCAKAGERNQGAEGYPAVPYKPCCSGKGNVEVYGEWGKFCPGAAPKNTNSWCYKPGERNQGESGYPAVEWKPCCDGGQAVKKYGDWGYFCPEGDSPEPPTPTKPGSVAPTTTAATFATEAPPTEATDPPPTMATDPPPTQATDPPPTQATDPPPTQATDPPPTVATDPPPTQATDPPPTEATDPPPTVATDPPPTEATDPPPTVATDPPPTEATDPPPTQGVCEGIEGVRPNADPIGNPDWNCYERGVLALQANGVWQEFVDIHASQGEHGGALFLVWHRAMLWEFEKELNAVEPGCKIPAYDSAADNTGVFNPAVSQVFTNNRAGTCNSLGPFSGIPSLVRECPSSTPIFGTAAMNNAITGVGSAATGTETDTSFLATYEEFNNWIEGVHGNFHVAVGGSMGSVPTASRDPVFYMHHAYIDKVWRQWQNARGGNDFGGERNSGQGDFVDTSVVMEPWGMTAGDVITRISGCIDYENANGGPVTRMEVAPVVRQGNSAGVRRDGAKGNPKAQGFAAPVVPVVEEDAKNSYQLQVAEEKISNPKGYERKVLEAKRQEEACVAALRALNAYSETFIKTWQRLEGFRLLALERIDLADAEVAEEAEKSGNTDVIVSEGEAEKEAIEKGEDLAAVNPKKVDEEAPTAVVTKD